MNVYDITQTDIELLHCHKIIHIKVYLLDKKTKVKLDELSGYITSGDGSDDSSSDVRKTCNFTIHSYDSSYDIGLYNRFWLNQLVQIDLGFEYNGQVHYYNRGTFVFNQCSYTYDGSTRDLSFQCSDLVTTIDGTHGAKVGQCIHCNIPLEKCEEHRGTVFAENIKITGHILNEETGLYEGNDAKQVVEDLLTQNGITDFRVDPIGQVSCLQGHSTNWKQNRIDTGTTQDEADRDEKNGTDDLNNDHGTWHMIPHDLEFDKAATLWEILTKIRDLYSGYEMFFDNDGTFVCQLIPTCEHDTNILDHTQFEGLVISENTDTDMTTIRNATKVYGQSIKTDRYTDKCTINPKTQYGNKSVVSTLPEFDLMVAHKDAVVIGVLFPKEIKDYSDRHSYFTINDTICPIVMRKAVVVEEDGIAKNVIQYDNIKYSHYNTTDMYCFKYLSSKKYWVYAGMYQIEGYCENNDENSPFAIDKIGYRLQILSGGNYDSITTSTLAQEHAEYENWLVSRLTDSITLEVVIIPFLEVNQKIQYKKLSDGSIDSYIIKSLSYSFTEGTMTITMSKFYELDPFIVCS